MKEKQRLSNTVRNNSPCKGCTERFMACSDRCPKDERGEYGHKAWKADIEAVKQKRKAYLETRQSKFIGQNCFGNKKLVWTIYVKCNKCHSRGKPIKTDPIKMYDEAHGSLGVGNFYCTEFWLGSGSGLMTATLNFEPYVKQAIEAWNRRAEDVSDK